MKRYFAKMQDLGKELKEGRIKRAEASSAQLREVEPAVRAARRKVEDAGLPPPRSTSGAG